MPRPQSPELVESRVASRQHGVVTRAQLLEAGLSDDVIDHRIRTRRLTRIHRGVYLVGVVAPPFARELAACLACGPAAALSHESAARLWGIRPGGPARVLEVTIPRGYRRRPGLVVHRVATLGSDQVTRLRGVPVTTPARTLYDLAGRLRGRAVERAVAEAVARRLTTVAELLATGERHAGRRGAGRLAAVLGAGEGAPPRTRSEAEERFLSLVHRGGVRPPVVNRRIGRFEVDFYWPSERLAVEVDGLAFHVSPRAFERDRLRDAELAARGVRVMRVTWRQITEEPQAVVKRLERALACSVSRSLAG